MMSGGVAATPPSSTRVCSSKTHQIAINRGCNQLRTSSSANASRYYSSCSSFFKLKAPISTTNVCREGSRWKLRLRCNSTGAGPGGRGSGESESRTVLDAFFLGKALGEALSERIESTVGEILGAVGKFQAEQQKQVQDFQEEVLERAKQAKEQAAREAMVAQGRTLKSSAANVATAGDRVDTTSAASASASNGASESPILPSETGVEAPDKEDPVAVVSDDE